MNLRTYVGYLLALLATVVVAFLAVQNRELLQEPFELGRNWRVPVFVAVIVAFLVGFLPPATSLFVQTVRRDLVERQERRLSRQAASIDQAFLRAVDYQSDSQLGKALEQLEIVLEARPDDFATLLRYGQVLRRLDRSADAVAVHRRAASEYPGSIAVQYELIEDHERLGDVDVANEVRNRAVRDFADRGVRALRFMRQRSIGRADWIQASRLQDEIDALLAGGPDEQASHRDVGLRRGMIYQRGLGLLEEDRGEDAAEVFRGLLEEEPRFVPARIMLGEASLLADDEEAALEEWRRGYRETGSPVFLQRIEDYMLEADDPLRAIEELRAVIAGASNDTLPRFFLGRLYYRLEMHDEAEKILVGIREHVDSSPTYHYLLGRIRARRGEVRLASESLLKSADLLGVREATYRCHSCAANYPDWRDRCESCGAWNSVELGFEREQLSSSDLGIRPRPAWGSAVAGVDEPDSDDNGEGHYAAGNRPRRIEDPEVL